ncbi:MAG: YigZ family protein [Ignavibacteria bacterium]|nr:YigZ family protein [Ignavibacteria bacterium]
MDACNSILHDIRKEFYDATHHCFAYRLLDATPRYSDDGEPSGTAGVRILGALDHFSFVNTCVIVIRYFGGTKLGVGPLGKAYHDSAYETLRLCSPVEKTCFVPARLEISFDQSNIAYRFLNSQPARIIATDFIPHPVFSLLVSADSTDKFSDDALQTFLGKLQLTIDHEKPVFLPSDK